MGMVARLRQVRAADLDRFLRTQEDRGFFDWPRPGAGATLDPVSQLLGTTYRQAMGSLHTSGVMQRVRACMDRFRDGEISAEEYRRFVEESQSAVDAELARVIDAARAQVQSNPALQAAFDAARTSAPDLDVPGGLGTIDLHKSWHCLNWLYTGRADLDDRETRDSPILGGLPLADPRARTPEGTVRAFRAPEVAEFARALAAFPWSERIQRWDAAAARALELYVPDHEPEELEHYAHLLVSFYADAARNGSAVLIRVD